ncbi:C-5 cytosine methyltransferase,DNA methylase, C-5 cytosine-specific, conserved site,S-adenosyl-L- [Cinara cedri]|uniref:tRNA (cytosine(38)-C(5))-methyltransferase n=1 Tax=Cinara cedri TaxID=506608 RepID=A0A5E4NHM9_9HEMI|nr:C-5 cytosine methyltransferase,DNA methylase, C-5 cytosine-specific, conserved site,S-adenosyl-L- [Cinara cedri]
MRVIEFFSGIGGMHFALKECDLNNFEVVLAADVNTVANTVYRHFFPTTNLKDLNILSLTTEQFDAYCPDVLLMSPPCQPFTRNGLVKDIDDERTKPLLHIIENIIPKSQSLKYILVENVKGFECSLAREKLISALNQSNFTYREFLLSPIHFGICNSRLRYYLLAKKKPLDFIIPLTNNIITENHWDDKLCDRVTQVSDVLCNPDTDLKEYLLSDKQLLKGCKAVDIVTKSSKRSCCFTRSYSSYLCGTGSVYSNLCDEENIKQIINENDDNLEVLKSLKLRFFTPTEISKFMCIPISDFPVSNKKAYQLLGNSLNVYVVSRLLCLLFN